MSDLRWLRLSLLGALVALLAALATALPAQVADSAPRTPDGATPTSPATPERPLRIAAVNSPVEDATGQLWQPDAAYAVGGTLTSTSVRVRNTASPVLYQHARLGMTDYRLPVAVPGTYFVDVFVAETADAQPDQRVWRLTAERKPVPDTVDVARDAGQDRAWHVLFAVPVLDGTLNLHVLNLRGVPMISALEVEYQSANVVTRTLFDDEFSGPAGAPPSGLRWQADVGGNGFGNNELQTYTTRRPNLALDGRGQLLITARRERWTGTDGITRDYTSARIKTADRFTFQYGAASARITVPKGRGLLPAFWALGDNIRSVGWPLCGEMDIMESLGSHPSVVHGTLHGGRVGGGSWLAGDLTHTSSAPGRRAHVYGVVWGPNAVAMSLDGRTYMTVSSADLPAGDQWNFNHSFFLILNLAVGGDWPGAPTAATHFPAVMSVDWVRVRG